MGIKSLSNNKKKSFKSTKTQKWLRQKKAEKKKRQVPKEVTIDDLHLYSDEKLKNKLRNPKNNIKISGKKKRRLTKRLGHNLREKSQMEVEGSNAQLKRGKQTALNADAEMADLDAEEEQTSESIATSSVTEATSSAAPSSGKKRRGRRKNKKKADAASAPASGGNMFEENDGWEDVEMAE